MNEDPRWTAGEHHGLAWRGAVALLDASVDPEIAEGVWSRLDEGFDLEQFVTVLGELTGRSLLELPNFAIAVRSEGFVHLAARGELMASATSGDERHEVRGSGVITWAEDRAQLPASMSVAATRDETARPARPVVAGLVLASRLALAAERDAPVPPVERPAVTTAPSDEEHVSQLPAPQMEAAASPSHEPEFGDLWGEHTIMRSVEDAAVRTQDAAARTPDVPRPAAPAPEPDRAPESLDEVTRVEPGEDADDVPGSELGDHDGATVFRRAPLTTGRSAAKLPDDGAVVPALICSRGHANPPELRLCRSCAEALSGPVETAVRPPLGRLVTTDGQVIDLTGPVVVGREPRAARFQGTEIPHLVELRHSHVSASHVAIRLYDWEVLASDLRSTNGTYLCRPGRQPVRMTDAPVPLSDGDVIDLGHGVHLSFEVGS